jgi:hypothetical protein
MSAGITIGRICRVIGNQLLDPPGYLTLYPLKLSLKTRSQIWPIRA